MSSISERLLDSAYQPTTQVGSTIFDHRNILTKTAVTCPVRFTEDPLEYAESKEFIGYKLKPAQKIVLEDLFSSDDQGNQKYTEAVFIAGMRSGKSIVAGVIGSFITQKLLALDDPGSHLGQVAGQKFCAEYIATNEQQSEKTAYSACRQIVLYTPWWKKYLQYLADRETTEGKETLLLVHARRIAFVEKNIEILSLHSSSASLAGLTAFFVCFDEMSRFDVSEGGIQEKSEKRTAQAVYNTASRAAKTLEPFSKRLIVTSPMYEDDFGMQQLYRAGTLKGGKGISVIEALRSKHPIRVPDIIGYHYSTFEANPKTEDDPYGYTEESFASEKHDNPAAYTRDYLAIPPSAVSPFFDLPERIDKSIIPHEPLFTFEDFLMEESVGQTIRKYIAKRVYPVQTNKLEKYFLCCDQGATKDSFAIAMGHGEEVEYEVDGVKGEKIKTSRFKVVIDLVEAWKPDKENRVTVSFVNVEDVIRTITKFVYISKVAYDSWHSTESIERLFAEGVYTEKLGATYEMYETMKLLLYSGMIDLPENQKLTTELKQLNIINGAKPRIDHPGGSGCFTGDTKIKLLDGTTPTIKELANKGIDNEFWVYSCLPDGTIVPAKARNARKTKEVKELVEVTLDNNEKIVCTPEHLFMLRDGSYKMAKDLVQAESLMPLYYSIHSFRYKNGGSGKYARIKNNKTRRWNWEHRFIAKFGGCVLTKDDIVHHKDFNTLNNIPDNLEVLSREEHARRHILANKKIHSQENIEKRIKTFKNNYANSEEQQKRRREIGCAVFNDPENRKKTNEGTKKYFEKMKLLGLKRSTNGKLIKQINNYENLTEEKKQKIKIQSIENLKLIPKQILVEQANKLNNSYWKSEEGVKKRKELAKTQLVEARKKRTNESFKKATETRKKNKLLKLQSSDCNEQTQNNHKVIKVTKVFLEEPIEVYDITVPIYENFALESGVFVHNSKDLADATVRVVWNVYTDCIRDAVHGKFMHPLRSSLPTLRSLASMSEIQRQKSLYDGDIDLPQSSIWGNGSGGAGTLFGRGFFVPVNGNVRPNVGK